MTIKFIILSLIIYISGIFAGRVTSRPRTDGVFVIDRSSPQKDILQIKLDIDVDELEKKNYILLRVNANKTSPIIGRYN